MKGANGKGKEKEKKKNADKAVDDTRSIRAKTVARATCPLRRDERFVAGKNFERFVTKFRVDFFIAKLCAREAISDFERSSLVRLFDRKEYVRVSRALSIHVLSCKYVQM